MDTELWIEIMAFLHGIGVLGEEHIQREMIEKKYRRFTGIKHLNCHSFGIPLANKNKIPSGID